MIGIDTNILVRYYAQDDPVSLIVIAELVWVLSSVYKLDKVRLVDVLGNLLVADELQIEQTEVFLSALRRFEHTAAEFTDLLIASTARHAGCPKTYTFDEGAAKKAGMKLLR
jgi:predicted nucleic-acid-binding protein